MQIELSFLFSSFLLYTVESRIKKFLPGFKVTAEVHPFFQTKLPPSD